MEALRKNWPLAVYAGAVVLLISVADALRLPLWGVLLVAALGAVVAGLLMRSLGPQSRR